MQLTVERISTRVFCRVVRSAIFDQWHNLTVMLPLGTEEEHVDYVRRRLKWLLELPIFGLMICWHKGRCKKYGPLNRNWRAGFSVLSFADISLTLSESDAHLVNFWMEIESVVHDYMTAVACPEPAFFLAANRMTEDLAAMRSMNNRIISWTNDTVAQDSPIHIRKVELATGSTRSFAGYRSPRNIGWAFGLFHASVEERQALQELPMNAVGAYNFYSNDDLAARMTYVNTVRQVERRNYD